MPDWRHCRRRFEARKRKNTTNVFASVQLFGWCVITVPAFIILNPVIDSFCPILWKSDREVSSKSVGEKSMICRLSLIAATRVEYLTCCLAGRSVCVRFQTLVVEELPCPSKHCNHSVLASLVVATKKVPQESQGNYIWSGKPWQRSHTCTRVRENKWLDFEVGNTKHNHTPTRLVLWAFPMNRTLIWNEQKRKTVVAISNPLKLGDVD